jgi:hypothetical protein
MKAPSVFLCAFEMQQELFKMLQEQLYKYSSRNFSTHKQYSSLLAHSKLK